MLNTIPLSVINKCDVYLLYFNLSDIETPEKIDKAFVIHDEEYSTNEAMEVCLNDMLSDKDIEFLNSKKQKKIGSLEYSGKIAADVSEIVKQIIGKKNINRGILLMNIKRLRNPRLKIIYHKDIIYPQSCSSFFDKELNISIYDKSIESPWFYSALSQTITIFAQNNGSNKITINLQNSPNAKLFVNDPQEIVIIPKQTVDIIPYKFSKFIRLVANSTNNNINLKMWFQTQLMNH